MSAPCYVLDIFALCTTGAAGILVCLNGQLTHPAGDPPLGASDRASQSLGIGSRVYFNYFNMPTGFPILFWYSYQFDNQFLCLLIKKSFKLLLRIALFYNE
jgi:hypothetical protein